MHTYACCLFKTCYIGSYQQQCIICIVHLILISENLIVAMQNYIFCPRYLLTYPVHLAVTPEHVENSKYSNPSPFLQWL